jgi:hypothetical protein
MNKVTVTGLVLAIVLLVPCVASCSTVTETSSEADGATYATSSEPSTVVINKTVPVVVNSAPKVVVVPKHVPAPAPAPAHAPWWHNWRWPWHRP